MVAKREGCGEMEWHLGVSKWRLLHIEWINNEVLLYSIGNCIQYAVTSRNGKKNEKECMDMYN